MNTLAERLKKSVANKSSSFPVLQTNACFYPFTPMQPWACPRAPSTAKKRALRPKENVDEQ
jgi:hypothetical protein